MFHMSGQPKSVHSGVYTFLYSYIYTLCLLP